MESKVVSFRRDMKSPVICTGCGIKNENLQGAEEVLLPHVKRRFFRPQELKASLGVLNYPFFLNDKALLSCSFQVLLDRIVISYQPSQ